MKVDYGVERKAAIALLSIASESPESKERVVQELVKLLESPAIQNGYYYSSVWSCACSVLGELKASDAIDVLASNLEMQHGSSSLTLSAYPTVMALVQIGENAVRRLKDQLLARSARVTIRLLAAEALGRIGSENAKEALEAGLSAEENENVRNMINASLQSIEHRKNRH